MDFDHVAKSHVEVFRMTVHCMCHGLAPPHKCQLLLRGDERHRTGECKCYFLEVHCIRDIASCMQHVDSIVLSLQAVLATHCCMASTRTARTRIVGTS